MTGGGVALLQSQQPPVADTTSRHTGRLLGCRGACDAFAAGVQQMPVNNRGSLHSAVCCNNWQKCFTFSSMHTDGTCVNIRQLTTDRTMHCRKTKTCKSWKWSEPSGTLQFGTWINMSVKCKGKKLNIINSKFKRDKQWRFNLPIGSHNGQPQQQLTPTYIWVYWDRHKESGSGQSAARESENRV